MLGFPAESSACTAGRRCVPSPGWLDTPVRRAESVSGPANPPLPWLCTVRGRRTAVLRTPREARSSTAVTARLRPATGPSVGSGSALNAP